MANPGGTSHQTRSPNSRIKIASGTQVQLVQATLVEERQTSQRRSENGRCGACKGGWQADVRLRCEFPISRMNAVSQLNFLFFCIFFFYLETVPSKERETFILQQCQSLLPIARKNKIRRLSSISYQNVSPLYLSLLHSWLLLPYNLTFSSRIIRAYYSN